MFSVQVHTSGKITHTRCSDGVPLNPDGVLKNTVKGRNNPHEVGQKQIVQSDHKVVFSDRGRARRTMISGLTILENLVLKIVNLK